nr:MULTISPECIES: FHA domain-containing protein [Myxococcaceae]
MRISKGEQAGRELALGQGELRIGRGPENELVLPDAGVSRRHARIYAQGGALLVEDVGSANGTELNGVLLEGPQALEDGDCICLGPVELVFSHAAADSTRILAAAEVRPRAPARAAALETVTPRPGAKLPAGAAARTEAPLETAPTAAERARRRRAVSGTLGGQLRLAWEGLDRRGKSVAGALALAALLAMAGTLVALFQPRSAAREELGPEPTQLTATPLRGSFGLGDGVTWERPDMKVFTFEFTAPTRAVALLRYQASGISKDEVSVSVNGIDQGWVPPDAGGASERELELVLPPSALHRNARNQLIFDNVKNPPGHEPWRIEGLRVEIIPVPELPPAELLASARESVAKARAYDVQRAAGSENLFRAWKNYRFAWVTLEALDERPELYRDVRYALAQVSADLDRECARLMLEFQRGVQYRDAKAVREAFEDVLRHFPTTEHRCHTLALEQRNRYAL